MYLYNSYVQLLSLSSPLYVRTATLVTATIRQSQASRDAQTQETWGKGLIPNSAMSSRFPCSISETVHFSHRMFSLSHPVFPFIWRERLKSLDIETSRLVISLEDSNLFFL